MALVDVHVEFEQSAVEQRGVTPRGHVRAVEVPLGDVEVFGLGTEQSEVRPRPETVEQPVFDWIPLVVGDGDCRGGRRDVSPSSLSI